MLSKLERTLSTLDRRNDEATAKEILVTNKRREIDAMMINGDITEAQAQTIGNSIDNYVQFNAANTRGGFERGLIQLIENQFRDLVQTTRTLSK